MIYKLKCVAYVNVGKRQSACISKQRSGAGDAFQFNIKYTCRRLETRKYNQHLNSIQAPIKSERATCEKEKALARREPTTYGFERQREANHRYMINKLKRVAYVDV